VAKAIRFLASDDASYITGTTIHIDGGLTARRAG
jgi:3-oxoacyl-[acyl-carrier protein] reductase